MTSEWAELDEYDFNSEPAAAYSEKLLTLFDATISMQPEIALGKPPLNILVHTIKGILYPTFVNALMLDFLRLMTMVEFHRQRVLEQAQTMVEWHTYFEDEDDRLVSFEPEDLAHLRQFVGGAPELRDCFVQMLAQSCREDLERVWITGSNTQFWVRWNDYFSIFKPNHMDSKEEPFHFRLSTDEVSQLRDVANQVIHFMEATTNYSIALKKRGKQPTPDAMHRLAMDDKAQTAELCDQLEAIIGSGLHPETLEIAEYYLEYITVTIPTIYDIMHRGDRRSTVRVPIS